MKPASKVQFWSRTKAKKEESEKKKSSPGRLELPTSRLTVGRANQLRHGDLFDEERPTFMLYEPKLRDQGWEFQYYSRSHKGEGQKRRKDETT